jgi:cyclopropane fatty-acyl-phospholipid synthase-like methyltransferase
LTLTPDARALFTERTDVYARFIRAMRYPEGLRAFWRASPLLRPGLRLLEAGCGTGALTFGVWDAAARRGIDLGGFDAFDLTPAMLDRLRVSLQRRNVTSIRLAEANVLHLDALPADWRDYNLIVSASMLEYVPRERFAGALRGLRERLRDGGRFVLFITRRNPLTRVIIGRWWQSNLYTASELEQAFRAAGFSRVRFPGFPLTARSLSVWGHVVEAER